MKELIKVLMATAHDRATPIEVIGWITGLNRTKLERCLDDLIELGFVSKIIAEIQGRLILEHIDRYIRFPLHKPHTNKKQYRLKHRKHYRKDRFKSPGYRLARLIRNE